MKITQFKKLLAQHGADFSRWEGVQRAEVEEFLRSSDEARALYEEAKALDTALDHFEVGQADPVVLDQVMSRIGGTQEKAALPEKRADAPQDRVKTKPDPFAGWGRNMQLYWFGAVACGVALLVFIGALGKSDQMPPGAGLMGGQPAQTAMMHTPPPAQLATADNNKADIDRFMAELGTMVEEDIAEQEIIGLLRMAEEKAASPAGQSPQQSASEEEIDAFLDQLFESAEDEPAEEKGLWELFLESETQEL